MNRAQANEFVPLHMALVMAIEHWCLIMALMYESLWNLQGHLVAILVVVPLLELKGPLRTFCTYRFNKHRLFLKQE